MANRFWVGNGGDFGDTAHWSTTSGGSSGASAPTASDAAIFDANSFTSSGQHVDISVNHSCLSLDFSAATHTPDLRWSASSKVLTVFTGNIVLSPTMTITDSNSTTGNELKIQSSGNVNIDLQGVSIAVFLRHTQISATTSQLSDIVAPAGYEVNLDGSIYNTNNHAITAGWLNFIGSNSSTFNAGSTVFTITGGNYFGGVRNGVIFNSSNANFNFVAGTSVMKFTYAANAANNNTYDLQFNGQTIGDVQFNGTSNSSNLFTIGYGTTPSATMGKFTSAAGNFFQFDAITYNIANLNLNGAAGNLITLRSLGTPAQYTLNATVANISFLDVKDAVAAGATPFVDTGGVNSGNNSGGGTWTFPAAVNKNFFFFSMT